MAHKPVLMSSGKEWLPSELHLNNTCFPDASNGSIFASIFLNNLLLYWDKFWCGENLA